MRHTPVDATPHDGDRASQPRTARRLILAGIAFIVVAPLAVMAPVLYEIWAKPQQVAKHQDDLDSAIEQQWEHPDPARRGRSATTNEDNLFGRLYLPRLDKHWVVVRGVSKVDIEYAPGVYPDSPPPELPGNVAIFGHRRKKIFWDLDRLGRGDLVFLETRTQWFTYRVYNTKAVKPNDTSVISWNPDDARVVPTRKLLTLITCTPKLSTTKRLIVQAELTNIRTRTAGPPPGLPTR